VVLMWGVGGGGGGGGGGGIIVIGCGSGNNNNNNIIVIIRDTMEAMQPYSSSWLLEPWFLPWYSCTLCLIFLSGGAEGPPPPVGQGLLIHEVSRSDSRHNILGSALDE